MPCQEVTDAISWLKQSTANSVLIYFSRHLGAPVTASKDIVYYASGRAKVKDTPQPHLIGSLTVASSKDVSGQMVSDSATYDVEIFPDGTLTYKLSTGELRTTVQATCVNNVILTATVTSFGVIPEVVTVGVARRTAAGQPPPIG